MNTPGPPLRDFTSYFAAGATWFYNGDPYSREVWRTERTIPGVNAGRDELLPFVGPPFGLPLWAAFWHLGWGGAAVAWGTALALALGVLALGSLRLAGRFGALEALAALALCAGFGPLTSGMALGQVAVVSCAAIVGAQLLLARPGAALGAVGAAMLAALQPNLALALAARLGDRRAFIALLAGAAVVVGGSSIAVLATGGFGRYLAVLAAHSAAERGIAIQTTCGAVAYALGLSERAAGIAGLALAAAVAIAVGAQCLSRRYDPLGRLAIASAALPLALPFAHEHDFTIALLPAIVCLRRARGSRWVLAAVGTLLIAVDWLGLAQRPTGVGRSVLLCLAAALAAAVLSSEPLRRRSFAPALVAVAVLGIGVATAAGHVLPTWPDGLAPAFHVPFAVPAPEVWRLEQLGSGIGRRDAWWGGLRALSLLGCALLWLAASLALRLPVSARAGAPSAAAARSRTSSRAPVAVP